VATGPRQDNRVAARLAARTAHPRRRRRRRLRWQPPRKLLSSLSPQPVTVSPMTVKRAAQTTPR